MCHAAALDDLLRQDTARMHVLSLVRSLALPDGWVGAGFVRNAVWDHLHGRPPSRSGDVDVIWHDPGRADPSEDLALEARLRTQAPSIDWSVKNQARMHRRNGDAPYMSATDAMRHWPETATAVAVRESLDGTLNIAAPFGLEDLFSLSLRPTSGFMGVKHHIYLDRVRTKLWLETWPKLCLTREAADPAH